MKLYVTHCSKRCVSRPGLTGSGVGEFAPGADGGDQLGDVAGVGEGAAAARLDAPEPGADGVGGAGQLRPGGGGGAAGAHPGLEGGQEQRELVFWEVEEAAEDCPGRLERGVGGGGDEQVDGAVAELGDPVGVRVAAEREPGEVEGPAGLVQLGEDGAGADAAGGLAAEDGQDGAVPGPVGEGKDAEGQLGVQAPDGADVEDREG